MKHWPLLASKTLNLLTPIFWASSFNQSLSPTAIALLQKASFDNAIFSSLSFNVKSFFMKSLIIN
jgi:hypothetical protein